MAGSRWVTLALVALLVWTVVPAPPATASTAGSEPSAVPGYLALGDSVAAGVGADGPEQGYVPRLHERLRAELDCGGGDRCEDLQLNNLSVSGATTWGLMVQQLPKAVTELATRNRDRRADNDVRVVTVTIGGNDVFHPVVAACTRRGVSACQKTVDAQLAQVAVNLRLTLRAIYLAAGADTTIAVMTYYNPLGSCDLAALDGLAGVVLEGGVVGETGLTVDGGLNDIIRQIAEHTGVLVAETDGRLGADDLVGGGDCLHPNARGHDAIAASFAEVILD